MDIELLRTFLEVKNSRHFGKAANNLFITQAAVSSRIKLLEQMLESPLFIRYRNNLQLTEAGDRLVSHAEDIIKAWELAKQDLNIRKTNKDVIRFAATTGFCAIILENMLGEIYRQIENIALRAESLDEETLNTRMQNRRIDLGLMIEPAKRVGFFSIPVTCAELVLVSTRQNASPKSALEEGYVAIDWGSSFAVKHQKLYPETPTPVLQTSLSRIALQFILDYSGSAYLPYDLVKNHLGERLHLVEDAPLIYLPIYAIHHQDCPYIKTIEQVIRFLKQNTPLHTISGVELEQILIAG